MEAMFEPTDTQARMVKPKPGCDDRRAWI